MTVNEKIFLQQWAVVYILKQIIMKNDLNEKRLGICISSLALYLIQICSPGSELSFSEVVLQMSVTYNPGMSVPTIYLSHGHVLILIPPIYAPSDASTDESIGESTDASTDCYV